MRERIRRERKVRDLTQKSLAEALSLSEILLEKSKRVIAIQEENNEKYQNSFGIRATELFPDIFEEFNDTKYT